MRRRWDYGKARRCGAGFGSLYFSLYSQRQETQKSVSPAFGHYRKISGGAYVCSPT